MRIVATSKPTAAATQDALMADMDEEVAAGRSFYTCVSLTRQKIGIMS